MMQKPDYMNQDSLQTLEEGIAEYYSLNKDIISSPTHMPKEVAELFRQHDAGHVLFGCDTSLRGETLVDIWTILATTAGFRGYIKYFNHSQVDLAWLHFLSSKAPQRDSQ